MRIITLAIAMGALLVPSVASATSTVVPGHEGRDGVVTGKYESVYAYDASGDYYWDLGDGRIQGTVGSVDELDESTLTVCDYQVVYRGDFGGDPFVNSGWISNQINCKGEEKGTFNSTYVSQDDPRYTGTGTPMWGVWEVHRDTWSQWGNVEQRL